jgi:hypothetical protein
MSDVNHPDLLHHASRTLPGTVNVNATISLSCSASNPNVARLWHLQWHSPDLDEMPMDDPE